MALEFDTTEYEFSHGRKPRGRGGWVFEKYLPHPAGNGFVDRFVFWAKGGQTLTEAKRELRQAGASGTWKVLP
jgi:hypothetical protein